MALFILGLSHKSAPVDVRERVVFGDERLQAALAGVSALEGVDEVVLVTTCNRTEIYAVGDPDHAAPMIQQWLENAHDLPPGWLAPYLYRHRGESAVTHLLTVAAGLDSMVLGEPQILGQVKSAYHLANRAGILGHNLERLFQHAFTVAKEVRTRTAIGSHPVSVAYAAVSLARQIFGDMDQRAALLVGAGETIELTARHLRELGVGRLVVANRNPDRARRLAAQYQAEGIALEAIDQHLAHVDVVISSTASVEPVLSAKAVRAVLRQRKHRPMFMVDLAVPRDIEPAVAGLPDIYLYTVDDLRDVIDDSLRSRRAAAYQAESIIALQATRFMEWLRSLDAVEGIRELREEAESTRRAVLARAQRRLAAGESPEQVLEYLSRTLTRKLVHAPTVGLREAARSGDAQRIRAGRRLLGLESDEDEETT